jgi:hypothetical protein
MSYPRTTPNSGLEIEYAVNYTCAGRGGVFLWTNILTVTVPFIFNTFHLSR